MRRWLIAAVIVVAAAVAAALWLTLRGGSWHRGTGNAACSKLAQQYGVRHPTLTAGTVVLACPGGGRLRIQTQVTPSGTGSRFFSSKG